MNWIRGLVSKESGLRAALVAIGMWVIGHPEAFAAVPWLGPVIAVVGVAVKAGDKNV